MKNSIFKRSGVFIIILLLPVIYFACDDAGVIPVKVPPFCITGKIAGWTAGGKMLYASVSSISSGAYVLASCPIDTDGNFSFCPPSLADTTLFPPDSIFDQVCNGGPVSFNPPNTKGALIISFIVFDGANMIGAVDCDNYTFGAQPQTGDFDVLYIYVNKMVTGNGYRNCMSDTIAFYGTAQSGWNKITRVYKRVDPGSSTIVYYNSTFEHAVWEFHGN